MVSPKRLYLRAVRSCVRILTGLALAAVAWGPEPALAETVQARAAIYARATNSFPSAVLAKPAPDAETQPWFKFAPLIIQQTERDGECLETVLFGAVTNAVGEVRFTPEPSVYASIDLVHWRGKDYLRFTYLWAYRTGEREPFLQGVRVTTDPEGKPVIWEPLNKEAGMRIVYVSENLERGAAGQHGAPLPGRHYSVEPDPTAAPDVVVARVLTDGPVPMGPIVYVAKDRRSVSAVACRCMPSQAKALIHTATYNLRDFHEAAAAFNPLRGRTEPAFWPGEETGPRPLMDVLRLPHEP